jgi:hypothetical protein
MSWLCCCQDFVSEAVRSEEEEIRFRLAAQGLGLGALFVSGSGRAALFFTPPNGKNNILVHGVKDVLFCGTRMERRGKQDRIKVLARVRPLNQREIAKNDHRVIETIGGQCIQFDNIGSLVTRKFQLDAVLDEDITQEEVFMNITPLLESYLDGYNCTIFTCKSINLCHPLLFDLSHVRITQMDKLELERHSPCLDMISGRWLTHQITQKSH